MKKRIALGLAALVLALTACNSNSSQVSTQPDKSPAPSITPTNPVLTGAVTELSLADDGITVNGVPAGEEISAVYISRDIIYYEDRDTYDSGNLYGEGESHQRHSAQEAKSHLVVNITQPGNYRLKGNLSQGQIRIDLGEDAREDPKAVVNLVLEGVDITCTVAPAVLFRNVYECDASRTTENASPMVDTTAAGANLILAGGSENVIHGSHVAKIYKDQEGEKKLWKQDGAIYSYMSMNVSGTGRLDLYADNEGLDTELHLTVNGGDIRILSDNDGINTHEDGVSVTTINGGDLRILAGLGEEGDGIDSNGYLVINGGTVVAMAHPAADAGLDSDLGSYIHGGTVVALGSAMDWAESDSGQVTMNLQFAQQISGCISVEKEDGTAVFAYNPDYDPLTAAKQRSYSGMILSCSDFQQGDSYQVYLDRSFDGNHQDGIYLVDSVTAYAGGIQQAYTGTDVRMHPGMGGGFGGGPRPEGKEHSEMPPDGERPELPEDRMPGGEPPEMPDGQHPNFPGSPGTDHKDFSIPPNGEMNSLFYMQDQVNFFTGLQPYTAE